MRTQSTTKLFVTSTRKQVDDWIPALHRSQIGSAKTYDRVPTEFGQHCGMFA